MIKFESTDVVGWEHAIRGMRNPMNSWDKSDSKWMFYGDADRHLDELENGDYVYQIGLNDLNLMKKLRNAGTDHRKFMRMITVYVDIIAPLYWWKEFDTYKVGTVANSCSTMHKIADKEFTLDDFSHEHLTNWGGRVSETYEFTNFDAPFNYGRLFKCVIDALNGARERYIHAKAKGNDYEEKSYWWQMIQILPTSYNQKRTVMLNYEVLANIYKSRKSHKLDEWRDFCDWVEKLPYFELITREN